MDSARLTQASWAIDSNEYSIYINGLFDSDTLNTLTISFQDHGRSVQISNYSNGHKNGINMFIRKGKIESVEYYKNDTLNAISKDFQKGILRSEIEYSMGVIDGMYKSYYTNGLLKYVAIYSDGKYIGTCQSYYRNGRLKYYNPCIGQGNCTSTFYKRNGKINKVLNSKWNGR